MVILLMESDLSLNGSDAKRHAPGVPVTGARGLTRGHHKAARQTMLSGRDRVSCAEPWERSAHTRFFASADYEAFVRVVKEALLIVPMRILGYCLRPCGPWVEHTARHLGLGATLCSRGRPPKTSSSQGNATSHDNNMTP